MPAIEAVSDVDNAFLSRREVTCSFPGMAGRLGKLEAAEMVSKELGLGGRLVIPVRLRNHVGKPLVTGTFFVYEDEALARSHVNPTVFARLDRARKKAAEGAGEGEEAGGGKESAGGEADGGKEAGGGKESAGAGGEADGGKEAGAAKESAGKDGKGQ